MSAECDVKLGWSFSSSLLGGRQACYIRGHLASSYGYPWGDIMNRQAYWTVCKLLRATDQYNSSHFVTGPPRVATISGYG
jgi:hypothetical protein